MGVTRFMSWEEVLGGIRVRVLRYELSILRRFCYPLYTKSTTNTQVRKSLASSASTAYYLSYQGGGAIMGVQGFLKYGLF
jgi:hypothetical protein